VECHQAISDSPSPHPRPDRARFIPRLGRGQQALLPLLVAHGVRTVVAPLHYLRFSPQLSLLLPEQDGLGRVFDPCTHLRQLPWQDRGLHFRELPFGHDPEPYDPDRSRLSDQDLLALALGPLDAQRSRGATLMLSTFHLAGAVGTRGRDIELTLAGLAVRHFRGQRMDEPPPFATGASRRALYATVAVALDDLSSARSRRELADAYLELGADGIWVKIAGFNERASRTRIQAAGSFLGALREGAAPVVCCGPGQLYLALLAEGISASIGISEGERFLAPRPWRAKGRGKPYGLTKVAYNATMHRSFQVGSPRADAVFAGAPCDCGEHEENRPPKGAQVARHAAVMRARQAGEALAGAREQRRERLLAAALRASRSAADASLPEAGAIHGHYRALFEGVACSSAASGAASSAGTRRLRRA
jgi:hypothetical protein